MKLTPEEANSPSLRADDSDAARHGQDRAPKVLSNSPRIEQTASGVSRPCQFVVFRLGEQRYALPLGTVERVICAVEVTRLPGAPQVIMGAFNLEGRVLPVLDLQQRFGLPARRDICPEEEFLIVQTTRRTVALVVDEAAGLIERPTCEIVDPAQIAPGLGQIRAVLKLDDGLVLIHDLGKLLSLEEEDALDEALSQEVPCAT